MALTYSTGLRTSMMGTTGFKTVFETGVGCLIDIYSGVQPATADTAPSGTLLLTISVNAAGSGSPLHFGTAAAGAISKAVAEVWRGNGVANGTAGWFRLRRVDDLGTTNTTDPRVDGTVASIGGDMPMNPTNITASPATPVTIDVFTLTATFT